MPFELATIATALATLGGGIATGAGGVVAWRRARREDFQSVLKANADLREHLQDRVEKLEATCDGLRVAHQGCLDREADLRREVRELRHEVQELRDEVRSDEGRTPTPTERTT